MSYAVVALALLSLAGLLTVVNSIQSADVKQHSIEATAAAPAAPIVTKDQTVERATAPSISSFTTKEASTARNSALLPSPRASASSPPMASPSLAAAPAKVAQATSLEVVHLHRLGDCRGRLDVTRDGAAFVSEEENDADAFTLKFAEFLHDLSDDTLTLRSATKTYRFKARESRGDGTTQLRELADRILAFPSAVAPIRQERDGAQAASGSRTVAA